MAIFTYVNSKFIYVERHIRTEINISLTVVRSLSGRRLAAIGLRREKFVFAMKLRLRNH